MKAKEKKGITLVALVVTIIVLIILAGVTLNIVLDQNGIIEKTQEARSETEEATLEEKIKLLVTEAIIDQYTGESGEKTAEELQNELNEQGENVLVIQWDEYIIFDLVRNEEYRVMSDGSVEYWGESTMGSILLNTKKANQEQLKQDSNTSNIIGIDNEGNTVNMLLWEYTLIDDNSLGKIETYGLNDENGLDNTGVSGRSAGYIGSYTEDGKILGTVPAYISEDGGETYISVTSMVHTFYDCDELIIAPEIADTVTDMFLTFYQASNLTTAPNKIPDSVIDFSYAFANCERLNTVPMLGKNIADMTNSFRYTAITEFNVAIPNNVTIMYNTFVGCAELSKFTSEIPNSVVNMQATFKDCTSLNKFDEEIPNSVINMQDTFSGCTTLATFASAIPDSVTNMKATFSYCTALQTGPSIIPSSVINMMQTFSQCRNLTGTIQINANLNGKIVYTYNGNDYEDYAQCFLNTSTIGDGLIISKDSTCPELENLFNEKSSNSNITIEE